MIKFKSLIRHMNESTRPNYKIEQIITIYHSKNPVTELFFQWLIATSAYNFFFPF